LAKASRNNSISHLINVASPAIQQLPSSIHPTASQLGNSGLMLVLGNNVKFTQFPAQYKDYFFRIADFRISPELGRFPILPIKNFGNFGNSLLLAIVAAVIASGPERHPRLLLPGR